MNHTTKIKCPYCKHENEQQLNIDALECEFSDTYECEMCEQPFFYTYEASVTVRPLKIEGFVSGKAATR